MSDITLPQGWSLPRLGELMAFKNGLNKGKNYFGHGTPIVNYMDVFNHSGMGRSDIVGLVDVTKAEKKAYSARRGDVFFTRTSETPEEVGISSILTEDINDAVFSGFVLRGRPQADRISTSFAEYCFASRFVREQIVASATYTTRALTNGRTLSAVRLPLPDDPVEQEAIAKALSDADGVVEGLERLIAKKRRIKQGAMQDLLTAKRRLPGFSGEWTATTLRKLLNGAPSYGINSAACPLGSGGYDYLRITDIDEHGQLRPDGRAEVLHSAATHYFLESNDIVVARTGASTGKSYIFRGPSERTVFAGFLIKLTPAPENIVPNFLFQFMQTDAYWSWITENSARSGQPGINGQQLSGLGLTIPADTSEQNAIAIILEDIDAEITALETRLQKARQIKEGMMQNLLTGRIRLV